jgi:hypothetical protein
MFAIVFGITSGCWTTLYFSRIQRLKGKQFVNLMKKKKWKPFSTKSRCILKQSSYIVDENTTMTMYGAYSMTRGLGNIISGPVSSALMCVKLPAPVGSGFAALDNKYSSLIFFCGVLMTLTTVLEGYLHYKTRVSVLPLFKSSLA